LNNSLFILTFDEDDGSQGNQIPTLFIGSGVVPGSYDMLVDHYDVLKTILTLAGIQSAPNNAASSEPISVIFSR
jgi:acid phosphatase